MHEHRFYRNKLKQILEMHEDPFLRVHVIINEGNARRPLLPEHIIANDGKVRRPL